MGSARTITAFWKRDGCEGNHVAFAESRLSGMSHRRWNDAWIWRWMFPCLNQILRLSMVSTSPALSAGGWRNRAPAARLLCSRLRRSRLAPWFPGYHIHGLIGRGGMGAVYRATQEGLEREVAIKVLPPEIGDVAGFGERFRREAKTLARLQHPCVVSVFDSGETAAGHLYYVMEFVDGEDLARRLARERLSVDESSASSPPSVRGAGLCPRSKVVHRDIKPSNILLSSAGGVKVADFGLAGLAAEQERERSRLTKSEGTLGTLEYCCSTRPGWPAPGSPPRSSNTPSGPVQGDRNQPKLTSSPAFKPVDGSPRSPAKTPALSYARCFANTTPLNAKRSKHCTTATRTPTSTTKPSRSRSTPPRPTRSQA